MSKSIHYYTSSAKKANLVILKFIRCLKVKADKTEHTM